MNSAADDDDPVVASYSVFIKPVLSGDRKLLVLQYPNKASDNPSQLRAPRIAEVRMKPQSSMLEIDVPLDTSDSYDRNKGMTWGNALQKSMATKGGGSLGLAGGFGLGSAPVRGGRRGANGAEAEEASMGWQEALRLDKVLRTQTLGGLCVNKNETRYMVGVFQGKNIHLTPVSSLVHLRPQLHHLDASSEQEKLSRQSSTTSTAPGAKEGRAIHMTLKSAMDDDGVATETIADRLRAVQTESWQRLTYIHDEHEAAWEAYSQNLLLRPVDITADDDGENTSDNDASGAPDLSERVPRLETDWAEEDMLRAISGIKGDGKKPGEEAVMSGAINSASGNGVDKGKGKSVAFKAEDISPDTKRRPGRPSKSSASAAETAATRRGPRPKASGKASGSMDID